ncbi:MAG: nicotinate (nicotinamide) nucleotide adenylyltransferase [Bacteroidales bacterium]|nr:nicotinate (nicotinamide) nucleotide adenylyltransferase [Bacteroidales bacterium]
MQKALFFGSFNPIHNAHLAIAEFVVNQNLADEVLFVVSPQSPFKSASELLAKEARLHLVELAVRSSSHLHACAVEFSLPTPSLTAETLHVFRKTYPDTRFSLLLGTDQVSGFRQWKNYKTILKYHPILFYPRGGTEVPDLSEFTNGVLIHAPVIDISATEIRNRIKMNRDVASLLPAAVFQEIQQMKYYR